MFISPHMYWVIKRSRHNHYSPMWWWACQCLARESGSSWLFSHSAVCCHRYSHIGILLPPSLMSTTIQYSDYGKNTLQPAKYNCTSCYVIITDIFCRWIINRVIVNNFPSHLIHFSQYFVKSNKGLTAHSGVRIQNGGLLTCVYAALTRYTPCFILQLRAGISI